MSDGFGCQCMARSASECCCAHVDWRSEREVELEAENAALKAEIAEAKKERDEIAQAMMLDSMVDERDEQLAAALAACEEREKALRWYMPMMPIEHQYRINNMLSIKPDASALKAHDDALIERCAEIAEKSISNTERTRKLFAAIRELKASR